jgi:hypothetical protein
MKTTTSVLTTLFEVLNVPAVTDLLTGGLHRYKRPENNAQERQSDIVLVPLTLVGSEDIVDVSPTNINIYAPSLSDNSVDETKLDEITVNVIEVIQAYSNSDSYYIIEIENQTPVTDEREQTFINMRVNIYHEQ